MVNKKKITKFPLSYFFNRKKRIFCSHFKNKQSFQVYLFTTIIGNFSDGKKSIFQLEMKSIRSQSRFRSVQLQLFSLILSKPGPKFDFSQLKAEKSIATFTFFQFPLQSFFRSFSTKNCQTIRKRPEKVWKFWPN